MSVPGAKVPTARILVVGVCGIGVLNCGFSPSVCSATVTSLFRRSVARWTPCHEAQRVANAAAIFLEFRAAARAPNYNLGDRVRGGHDGSALATALLIAVCSGEISRRGVPRMRITAFLLYLASFISHLLFFVSTRQSAWQRSSTDHEKAG